MSYVYPNADHAFARVNGVHWDGRSATIANGRSAEALVAALGQYGFRSGYLDAAFAACQGDRAHAKPKVSAIPAAEAAAAGLDWRKRRCLY